jgi:hypothetical protein
LLCHFFTLSPKEGFSNPSQIPRVKLGQTLHKVGHHGSFEPGIRLIGRLFFLDIALMLHSIYAISYESQP